MRLCVVEWKSGSDFPIDELNRGMVKMFDGHNIPVSSNVQTNNPERLAIVIAPRPIPPSLVAHAWGQFLEHIGEERGEKNLVEIEIKNPKKA